MIERSKHRLRAQFTPNPASGKITTEHIARYINIEQMPEHRIKLWRRHLKLVRNYRERPYTARLDVFSSYGQPAFSTVGHDLGWGKLASKVNVHVTKCPHHAIVKEPYIKDLASALRQAMLDFFHDETRGYDGI